MPRTRKTEEPDYLMTNQVNENRRKIIGRHKAKTTDVMGVGQGNMVLLIMDCGHLATTHESQLLPYQKFYVCLQCHLENTGINPSVPKKRPSPKK
jgi:hypothetical protein